MSIALYAVHVSHKLVMCCLLTQYRGANKISNKMKYDGRKVWLFGGRDMVANLDT